MPGFPVCGAPARLCVGLACVLSLWNTVSAVKEEARKEKVMTFIPTAHLPKWAGAPPALTLSAGNKEVKKEKAGAFLGATELPARSVDLSALNLTQVVNGMLSRVLKDSKKFFSLLSITSYSSFAFHKVSVAVYNISHLRTVDPARFPTRHCYCLNNRTNDLSDFTALLVDFIGNSTSYLTEMFKSTSILSVSQTNASDCIFVCVMTGKAGRNLSDFWEVAEESPVINYTFTSSLSGVPGTRGTAVASNLPPTNQQMLPRTSPSRVAWSTSGSALRTSPRTETMRPSEGEQTVNMDRLPELLAKATAMLGSISPTLPGLATRRATANGQARASGPPGPWAQTTREEAPGDPPWEPLPSRALLPAEAQQTAQPGTAWSLPEPPAQTQGSPPPASPTSGTFTPGTQTPSPTKAPAPRYPQAGDLLWPFTPGEEPALILGLHQVQVSRCPRQLLREGAVTAVPVTLAVQKLNPCLMELCQFFQQCLCMSPRREPRAQARSDKKAEAQRMKKSARSHTSLFCLEYYSWFLKNATYICQRANRVPRSHTLKQRCLESICQSV